MAAATGSVDIGLGAPYAELIRVEFKGDSTDVDNNTTFAITDAEGRAMLVATALDAGSDDSTALTTSQDFSTAGLGYNLIFDEAKNLLTSGAVGTDNVGGSHPIAKSPVTVDLAAGTSGDVFEITLFVEV
jgi:hypothetical protein